MAEDSLHPEYRTFLRLLRLLAYYAPEHYYHLPSFHLFEDSDEPWVREHIQDLHLISQDDYLDHIYTRRKIEENLRKEFLLNPDLIYLIAPLGAGKTSLALRLRKDLHASALHSCYVCYVDVRHSLSGRDQSELADHDLREFLRQLVIDTYLADLFPYERRTPVEKNPNLQLWSYLLDIAAQPAEEARGVSQGLAKLQGHAALLFDGYSSPKFDQGQQPTYYDWLEQEAPQKREVRELLDDLGKKLDLKHLASTARNIRHISRQVIWFDNVDALEYGQQDAIHEHLRVFQTNVAGSASIVISLRDENIRHFDLRETRHEHGAPPYGRRFVIEMPSGDHYLTYPGHVLPPPSEETIRTSVRKWLDATRRLQSKKIRALLDLVGEKEAELSAEVDDNRKDVLGRQIAELKMDLSHFSPAISGTLFDYLAELSARATEVLIREGASHLANNSLRDVFRIHRDFLADLLRRGTTDTNRPVALEYQSWYLATLFLAWIRVTERPFKLVLEDVFEHYQHWSQPESEVIGCSLPYLIINTLWNLEVDKTKAAGRRGYPTLGDLYSRLALLGYRENEILGQLRLQLERSIVQLRFPERSFEMGYDTQLYATYCGKCLTGSTFNSFGYLFECLEKAKAVALDAVPSRHPLAARREKLNLLVTETGAQHQHLGTAEAIAQLLPYLEGVASMHLTELVRIRDAGRLGNVGWLARYRDFFGIPNEAQFRRDAQSDQGGNSRKVLQLEAMLRGLLSYVKKMPETKKHLAKLLAEYAQRLHALERFLE